LREAHDMAQLETVWNRLDASERAIPELALAAALRGNQLVLQRADAGDEETRAVASRLRAWLEPLWLGFDALSSAQQRQLVLAFEPGLPQLDSAWLARLEQQQRLSPNNAFLQYLAGQACMQRQLWGKASQLLTQASHGLSDAALMRRTWRSLALLAEERGDEAAAQTAWKRAALLD